MERTNYIDYAKAICIILVVFIHIGFSTLNNLVLFAMPVFFAATGYTYTCGKRTFKEGALLRFKSVLVPFWYMMIFYTLLEIVRAYLFGYGTASVALPSLANAIYGSGVIPFEGGIFNDLKEIMSYKAQPESGVDLILPSNCHLWFLPAMFTGYLLFTLLAKVTVKNHFAKAFAIFLLLIVSMLEVFIPELYQLPYGLGRGAMGAAFMLVGFWMKEYGLLEKRSSVYYIVTGIISLAIYIVALFFGSDGSLFVRSLYGPYGVWSVILTFLGGVAGIWLIYGACTLIDFLPLEGVKRFLSFTGRNVITVYLWHMAVKFVLDAVYLLCKGFDVRLLDEFKMGLLPQNSWVYMLFEAFLVISVCLFACRLKEKKLK